MSDETNESIQLKVITERNVLVSKVENGLIASNNGRKTSVSASATHKGTVREERKNYANIFLDLATEKKEKKNNSTHPSSIVEPKRRN